MTKSKAPVSSFGPELQNALRAGSNERIELAFETESLAIRFAARINALRSAMRRENHPDSDRLYRAGVYCEKKLVIIAPKDSEFREVLRSAGVSDVPPTPSVHHIDVATPRPGVEDDPADAFLRDLTEATTVPKPEVGEKPGPSIISVDNGDK